MEESKFSDPCVNGVDSGDQFNFKCSYCGKNLSSRQNLKEHINIHTGIKPYGCNYPGCGKSFRQGSLLSIHKRIHLDIDEGLRKEKKPYKKPEYPKLTALLNVASNKAQASLNDTEKHEWLSKIDESQFQFLKSYLENKKIEIKTADKKNL